jgi:hypothetical protein
VSSAPFTPDQIEAFLEEGFVRLDGAFTRETADAGRAILWRDTGFSPDDPATWSKPVVRLGMYGDPPFREAANTAKLHAAFDQLVGVGLWEPRPNLGTFPVRFPSPEPPGDDGWHIDTSFPPPAGEPKDFFSWRANLRSDGRALLMLFLFSDVGEDDAPTRVRTGSHKAMARRLAPLGEAGVSLGRLAKEGFDDTVDLPIALATGRAGDVWLCHPFLVHAAQPHRGRTPKFMAQPPLMPARRFDLERDDCPVVEAIRRALAR